MIESEDVNKLLNIESWRGEMNVIKELNEKYRLIYTKKIADEYLKKKLREEKVKKRNKQTYDKRMKKGNNILVKALSKHHYVSDFNK